jgi:NADH:ubiquinone oxidoreductase subunit 6 (subunit J)
MFVYFDVLPTLALLIGIFTCTLLSVTSKNPINSIIFLMISMVNLAVLLLYLGAQFISLLILFIYVGAISILLIFVIMILDLKALFFDNFSIYLYNVLFIIFVFFSITLLVYDSFSFFSIIYNNSN